MQNATRALTILHAAYCIVPFMQCPFLIENYLINYLHLLQLPTDRRRDTRAHCKIFILRKNADLKSI